MTYATVFERPSEEEKQKGPAIESPEYDYIEMTGMANTEEKGYLNENLELYHNPTYQTMKQNPNFPPETISNPVYGSNS